MDAEWPVRHETGNCGCGIDHCMTLCNVRTVVAVGLVLCHDHAVLSISRLDVNVLAVGRQREKLSRFSWLFCITFFHLHHWGLLVCFSSNACPKWSMQVLIEISLPFDLPTWLSTQPSITRRGGGGGGEGRGGRGGGEWGGERGRRVGEGRGGGEG